MRDQKASGEFLRKTGGLILQFFTLRGNIERINGPFAQYKHFKVG